MMLYGRPTYREEQKVTEAELTGPMKVNFVKFFCTLLIYPKIN